MTGYLPQDNIEDVAKPTTQRSHNVARRVTHRHRRANTARRANTKRQANIRKCQNNHKIKRNIKTKKIIKIYINKKNKSIINFNKNKTMIKVKMSSKNHRLNFLQNAHNVFSIKNKQQFCNKIENQQEIGDEIQKLFGLPDYIIKDFCQESNLSGWFLNITFKFTKNFSIKGIKKITFNKNDYFLKKYRIFEGDFQAFYEPIINNFYNQSYYRVFYNKTIKDILKNIFAESKLKIKINHLERDNKEKELMIQYNESNMNFLNRCCFLTNSYWTFDEGTIVLDSLKNISKKYKDISLDKSIDLISFSKDSYNYGSRVFFYNNQNPFLCPESVENSDDNFIDINLEQNNEKSDLDFFKNIVNQKENNEFIEFFYTHKVDLFQCVNFNNTKYHITQIKEMPSENSFEFYVKAVKILTPRPFVKPIAQMELAKICLPSSGHEAGDVFKDEKHRVMAYFIFDNKKTKIFLPLSNSLAFGEKSGSSFLPRVDSEVVVNFLNGNPDSPIITGSLYNKKNDMDFNAKETGYKLHSLGNKERVSETYHDLTDGEESLNINLPHDINISSEDGKCNIELKGKKKEGDLNITLEEGNQNITLKKGDLTIEVSDTIKIHGKNINIKADEKISMEANNIDIIAKQNLKSEANNIENSGKMNIKNSTQSFSVDSTNTSLTAKANTKITSSINTELTSTMAKIQSSAMMDFQASGILNIKSMSVVNMSGMSIMLQSAGVLSIQSSLTTLQTSLFNVMAALFNVVGPGLFSAALIATNLVANALVSPSVVVKGLYIPG